MYRPVLNWSNDIIYYIPYMQRWNPVQFHVVFRDGVIYRNKCYIVYFKLIYFGTYLHSLMDRCVDYSESVIVSVHYG